MEERKKYIHYGSDKFDKDLFLPIQNRPMSVKPFGGLWASPVDAKLGWKRWCEGENFHTERLMNSFEFTLSQDAKVLHIFSVSDLEGFPLLKDLVSDLGLWVCLDFEELVESGYDAVELHLSEEKPHFEFGGLYYRLYGWDCDSILVMNPDVIVVEDKDGE